MIHIEMMMRRKKKKEKKYEKKKSVAFKTTSSKGKAKQESSSEDEDLSFDDMDDEKMALFVKKFGKFMMYRVWNLDSGTLEEGHDVEFDET